MYSYITIPTRLDPNWTPNSRFGLVPAYNQNSPARAGGIEWVPIRPVASSLGTDTKSIIFIHGLGSNPDTTWCARRSTNTSNPNTEAESNSEQNVNWVSDLLPYDLPAETRKDIRMFFYNYDSYWKRDAVYTRLKIEGNKLLEHIRQIRRSRYVNGDIS